MLIEPSMVIQETIKRKKFYIFKKEFEKRKKHFESALEDVLRFIGELKVHQKNRLKIGIPYYGGRIKESYSIIRKAIANNIPAKRIFDTIDDIVGIRVVVNNLKDVAPLIEELKNIPQLKIINKKYHKDMKGYRALHLNACYSVKLQKRRTKKVKIEIQIRTLLQDVWAILAHHDIYKNKASLPRLARSISENMSEMMRAIDKLSNDFRKEIETKVEPPNDLSDAAPLDKDGLAFLYYEVFGSKPEEYEIQWLIRVAEEGGLRSVGDARKGILKEVFDRIRNIHDKRFKMMEAGNDDLLGFALKYAAKGSEAYNEYKKLIEDEWAGIEATARGENLSRLPDTFDEFVDAVRSGDVPWEAFIELGGVEDCARCGTQIFVPEAATEGVLSHYGFPDTDTDLEALLFHASNNHESPFEPESVDFSGVCSWCGHMMSKDD